MFLGKLRREERGRRISKRNNECLEIGKWEEKTRRGEMKEK